MASEPTGFGLFELVRLRVNMPGRGLKAGDVGTIVELYSDGSGFEVEFADDEGKTISVVTLLPGEVEHTGKADP